MTDTKWYLTADAEGSEWITHGPGGSVGVVRLIEGEWVDVFMPTRATFWSLGYLLSVPMLSFRA